MTFWQSMFFVGAGLFTVAGAALDWNFFMNNRRARAAVRVFGRNGARAFYFILGLVFCVIGLAAFLSGR